MQLETMYEDDRMLNMKTVAQSQYMLGRIDSKDHNKDKDSFVSKLLLSSAPD